MKKLLLVLAVTFIGTAVKAQTNDSIPEIEEVDIQETVYKYVGRTVKDTTVVYKPTTSFLLRFGFVNLATDNQFANSDFGYMRSTGFEWGVTQRRPFSKDKNLLGIKYGVTFSYNSIAATDNRVFVLDGNQTILQASPQNLRKSHTYFTTKS